MLFPISLVLIYSLAVSAADFNVTVGANNQLVFDPTSVTVQNGDTVHFEFVSKNHTVTQSTFASPCTQMESGIDSGFLNASNPDVPPICSFKVNDASSPFWFYCAQQNPVNHCQTGMVFAVNSTAGKSFDAFQTAAKNSAQSNSTSTGTPAGTIPVTTLSTDAPVVISSGIPSSSAGPTTLAPSGSGFSTSGAAASSTGSSAASNQTPNGAIVTRDLSSTGVVTFLGLIAAFISIAV